MQPKYALTFLLKERPSTSAAVNRVNNNNYTNNINNELISIVLCR